MPDDAEIGAMYADNYFADGGDWVCGYWPGSYAANELNLRAEAREVIAGLGLPCRLLEVGCAGGFFLDEARAVGFDVSGIELNSTQVAHARSLGLCVECATIESFGSATRYDMVVAQDVIEHLRNPLAFMLKAFSLLRDEGTLIVRGPLEDDTRTAIYQRLRKLRRSVEVLQTPPFHLQGFTPMSFKLLCTNAGFSVDTFDAHADRIPFRKITPLELVSQMIEWSGYIADRVRGGGMFMVARARKR